jgi:ABC-2 type transport system ATP-binding protein
MGAVDTFDLRREFRTTGLKRGSEVVALNGVSLTVEEGEIHGLLGPNGAGKTTLIKILSTILLPSSGRAEVFGHDVVEETKTVRRMFGLVFGGDRGLYTRLTARQNLDYWAALYEVPAAAADETVERLIGLVGLDERADDRVETFSRGMRQRLHLARGLVADPRILFLDEPTVGLDPVASLDFREMVIGLRSAGKTIFIATHDMAEAEAICDRVTLIDHGDILATESPRTLGTWISAFEWVEVHQIDAETRRLLSSVPGVASVTDQPGQWVRFQPEQDDASTKILRLALDRGFSSVRTGYPSLEEVYLRTVGERGMEL